MAELDKDYYTKESKKLDIYQEYYETPEYSMDYIDFLKNTMTLSRNYQKKLNGEDNNDA